MGGEEKKKQNKTTGNSEMFLNTQGSEINSKVSHAVNLRCSWQLWALFVFLRPKEVMWEKFKFCTRPFAKQCYFTGNLILLFLFLLSCSEIEWYHSIWSTTKQSLSDSVHKACGAITWNMQLLNQWALSVILCVLLLIWSQMKNTSLTL